MLYVILIPSALFAGETLKNNGEIVVFSNSNQNELDTPLSRNHFHSYVNHIAQKLMDLKDSLLHCMPASTYYNDTTHFPTDCVVENSKGINLVLFALLAISAINVEPGLRAADPCG